MSARLIRCLETEIEDWRAELGRLGSEQWTYDGPITPANDTTARDKAEIEKCIAENERIIAARRN